MVLGGKLHDKMLIAGAAAAALLHPIAGWAQAPSQIPQPPADLPPPHGPLFAYAIFNWLFVAAVIAYLLWAAWRTRSVFPSPSSPAARSRGW
jgi:hypothetical protein